MHRIGGLARVAFGLAIVAAGVSGAVAPAQADGAVSPGTPTRVSTSNATGTSLDLTWSAPEINGGAAIGDYIIEYRKVGELTWSTVTHTASTATTTTVTGLAPRSTYIFRIAAVNSAGAGGWSGQASILDAGFHHSCALMAEGSAKCWGNNDYGQLGNNSTTDSSVPVLVSGVTGLTPASTAVSVSTGFYHSCALMAAGTAQCWGTNSDGQLGNNSTTDSSVPVLVSGITGLTPATTAVSVSTGGYHSCALMVDGTAQCWGYNGEGRLGDNSTIDSSVPVLVSGITGQTATTTAVSVSAGGSHSCAVMADGTAQCWGYNGEGELGNNSTTDSSVPVLVSGITGLTPATTAVSVSTSADHSCAVMADGTAQCWGYNGEGELGNNSTASSPVPVLVSGITGLTPATTAVSVSAGGAHSCAVMADGTARCWGYNDSGELGNNLTADSPIPAQVSGITGLTPATTAVSVSAGAGHSCALLADGTARCWGWNGDGQLGNNSTTNRLAPVPVSGIDGASESTRVAQGAWGRTLAGAPEMPTGVSASGATSSSLVVSWTAPSSDGGSAITDYVVQYRLASASAWTTFAHTASPATSITVTGLTASSSYVFRVAAANTIGTGINTDPFSAVSTLAAASTAPGMPTGVNASGATSSSLVVSWTAPSSDGGSAIIDYVVQYRLATENSWSTFAHTASAATSITVTGLTASSSYVFKVAAVNTAGTGINTDPSSPVSTLDAPVLNAPGAPGKPVIGVRTTTSVAISWTAAASNGYAFMNYFVEFRKGVGAWTTFARADSTALFVTVTELTKGGSYTFRVSAVSAGGTSVTSVVSAAALVAAAPGAPGSLAGKTTKVAGQIKVTWTAGSLNGAPSATYKVSWLVGTKWTTPVTATGFAYTITGLRPGTYSVKVTVTTSQGSASATKAGIVLKK